MSWKQQNGPNYCRLLHHGPPVTQGYKIGRQWRHPPRAVSAETAFKKSWINYRVSQGDAGVMSAAQHLLLVDDDKELCALLSKFLTRHGYRVSVAHNGNEMTSVIETSRVSLVILDLMLPGEDGLALCRRIRSTSTVPIIMLTAVAEEVDRIIGLEMGADDYIAKVANPRELLARVRAVLRRVGVPDAGATTDQKRILEFAGWRLDVTHRQLISPKEAMVPLRAGEFELLLAFAERPQRVLSRDQLLDLSRGRSASVFDRSIDVQVSRLRRKIEVDPKEPALIKTVRSGGYILAANVVVVGA
jgi:two-component system, OmpR family, response regulator